MPFKTESDSVLLACVSFEPSNDGKWIFFAHALLKSARQKNSCCFFPSMHVYMHLASTFGCNFTMEIYISQKVRNLDKKTPAMSKAQRGRPCQKEHEGYRNIIPNLGVCWRGSNSSIKLIRCFCCPTTSPTDDICVGTLLFASNSSMFDVFSRTKMCESDSIRWYLRLISKKEPGSTQNCLRLLHLDPSDWAPTKTRSFPATCALAFRRNFAAKV